MSRTKCFVAEKSQIISSTAHKIYQFSVANEQLEKRNREIVIDLTNSKQILEEENIMLEIIE